MSTTLDLLIQAVERAYDEDDGKPTVTVARLSSNLYFATVRRYPKAGTQNSIVVAAARARTSEAVIVEVARDWLQNVVNPELQALAAHLGLCESPAAEDEPRRKLNFNTDEDES